MKIDTIEVYTDGSYQKGKCGYGIYFPNKEIENVSEKFDVKEKTNNRSELYAIKVALDLILSKYDVNKIYVYSDSEYCIKSLTIYAKQWSKNGWILSTKKSVKNQDIIKPLYELIESMKNKIVFVHVLAHTGKKDIISLNNEKADELAKAGAFKK
jgi:ribonuclease HI